MNYKLHNGLVNRCDITATNNREPFNQVASLTVSLQ